MVLAESAAAAAIVRTLHWVPFAAEHDRVGTELGNWLREFDGDPELLP
jgi:hypothetical protein